MILNHRIFLVKPVIRRSSSWSSKEIRSSFIDFFKNEGHTFVRSSPIIPDNDPSLLIVNAGMNQFKPIFLEQVAPGHPFSQLKRAVNSQKCIRCGGKHNDLDAVGRDFRHHTFFEMLGNWSFGDYGKQEAIRMSWHLLMNVFKLDPSRIVITYFSGDAAAKLESDSETEHIWRSIIQSSGGRRSTNNQSFHQPHLIGLGSEDNFWEMGFTGPCGPCTEIHYLIDRHSPHPGHASLDIMSRTTEIWNLVFMQFNRTPNGVLEPLSKQHVDTGMGLERMASILQTESQKSNYDTDLFTPLFACIQKETGQRPYSGLVSDPVDIAYRVVADHARMYTVAIADGLRPHKKDAGHKLRRVIRSAHWELVESFNVGQPFDVMARLCDCVNESLGEAFPEIGDNLSQVKTVLKGEVGDFHERLRRSRKKFKRIVKDNRSKGMERVTGEQAFSIYKQLGCPVQLLYQLGHRYSIEIDFDRFDQILKEEHERSIECGSSKESVNSS